MIATEVLSIEVIRRLLRTHVVGQHLYLFGEVESTKSVSDVYAPLSGSILDRNDRLADEPEILNQDPYGDGWMVVIEVSDPSEVAALLEPGAYRELTESEAEGS